MDATCLWPSELSRGKPQNGIQESGASNSPIDKRRKRRKVYLSELLSDDINSIRIINQLGRAQASVQQRAEKREGPLIIHKASLQDCVSSCHPNHRIT
mmetsp:Transcript_28995/g.72288  ORF Transcript_28995/g.72288 Transcript_28995/m.72288 type:complete len:98 (+) Transcript_28995:426-719(+)